MANHASTRTTQRYDRRAEQVTLDEVERILVSVREVFLLRTPSRFVAISVERARPPWLRAFSPDFILSDSDTIFDYDSCFSASANRSGLCCVLPLSPLLEVALAHQ
jgi:hypothetical protein